jgi:hypothetical protein
MKVAVLGTSMSGFMAAHAATEFCKTKGFDVPEVVLYGPSQKYRPAGARFYERKVPGIDVEAFMVKCEVAGSFDDYANKIEGPITIYNKPRPDFLAYDYHTAYSVLFDKFKDHIVPQLFNRESLETYPWFDFDFVINTMPRPTFYHPDEMGMFAASRQWRMDESIDDETMSYRTHGGVSNNHMIFDGTKQSSFYRISQLFTLMTVEWAYTHKPPIAGAYLEILPLGIARDAALTNITEGWHGTRALVHAGPMARWEPDRDISNVFLQVEEFLSIARV